MPRYYIKLYLSKLLQLRYYENTKASSWKVYVFILHANQIIIYPRVSSERMHEGKEPTTICR